jgi:CRISPR-associated protein Csb2
MSTHLCITVRWIGDRFHGFIDGTESIEWPPSPFRLFQALVASAHRHGMNDSRRQALLWLERQQTAPELLALSDPNTGVIFDQWVPDNDNLVDHRKGSIRKFKPVLHGDRPIVHYVWSINPVDQPSIEELDDLAATLGWFGWAIDSASATAKLATVEHIDSEALPANRLLRFQAIAKTTRTDGSLRVAKAGSTAELERLHNVNRIAFCDQTQRRKKKWPKAFDRFIYTTSDCPIPRPHAVFKIADGNDDTVTYSQSKLIHITGMVRHLAIEAMTKSSPPADELRGLNALEWLRAYVAGHQSDEDRKAGAMHTQFSYIPLQSIGKYHTDPGIRRVMITAPVGDNGWLEHLADHLDGEPLKPLPNTTLPPGTRLERIDDKSKDGVRDAYLRASDTWASVTPVILPGHDDHKPDKTRRLILKALQQSGIDQPCEFEWSAFSYFPKSLSAHKYDRQKRPAGYIRPDHLLNLSAVHLRIRFEDDRQVLGPLAIGAGRHCGLGIFARVEERMS